MAHKQNLLKQQFHKAGNVKFEEYYTTYKEVEYLFTEVIELSQLKDKIIYLPADGEKSNFVIYLIEHKNDIEYKELIYTSDDFQTHEDLFNKADFVITNPPFSLIPEMLTLCKNNNTKFFLFGSMSMIRSYLKIYNPYECKYLQRHLPFSEHFECPVIMKYSGDYTAYVNFTIYMSNMELLKNRLLRILDEQEFNNNFLHKTLNDINPVYAVINDEIKGIVIDKMRDIPCDYDGYLFLPTSCYSYRYTKYLDYYNLGVNSATVFSGLKYSDNKSRYERYACKLKKEYLKLN